ncbi:hypothetical protein JOE50_007607 [Bradyrhizobium japonicum]|nr:hypothetical protein [Bradyrhizobium japonicum]
MAVPLLYQWVKVPKYSNLVMAGLVQAIHALLRGSKNVDARDKPRA